ncbi:SMI1/KNR4 family protein [Superficieibacter electus]|uniref:SMI1/KNR4 family protein n=1 Tax=Superficieibacter electus TaxID=2022662 RepID=A0A2P5GNU6_9ENTR|nr:SMI1/KNR4 family protein [Superficieibacter electus]POP44855.1 SMI1/KNR4 family protein [Superficieibacter electus]POP48242.1 SMI1/KNR4 family protein [Superficieibacter electus]
MQLTDGERKQISRIQEKIPQIHQKDPHYKIFGSEKWHYQWPEPAEEGNIATWEEKHNIILPRSYRIFLRYIANGGPGFAWGLYPLEKTRVDGNLTQDSVIPLDMTQQEMDAINDRQQKWYDASDDVDMLIAYNGLLTILTEGCTYDICLVVTGEYRGRLIATDGNCDYPFEFIYDEDFLDWYERWLDGILCSMDMDRFGTSVPGSQMQLRAMYNTADAPVMRLRIISSLSRFALPEYKTLALMENICREKEDLQLCAEALRILFTFRANSAHDLLWQFFNTPGKWREFVISKLKFIARRGENIDRYIFPLFRLLPELNEREFPSAIFAIQETKYNRFKNFTHLLHKVTDRRLVTLLYALQNTPDFISDDHHIDMLLPLFAHADCAVIRQLIETLGRVQDRRILPLVKQAVQRFPELSMLYERYYPGS